MGLALVPSKRIDGLIIRLEQVRALIVLVRVARPVSLKALQLLLQAYVLEGVLVLIDSLLLSFYDVTLG